MSEGVATSKQLMRIGILTSRLSSSPGVVLASRVSSTQPLCRVRATDGTCSEPLVGVVAITTFSQFDEVVMVALNTGETLIWGRNDYAQLGDGTGFLVTPGVVEGLTE